MVTDMFAQERQVTDVYCRERLGPTLYTVPVDTMDKTRFGVLMHRGALAIPSQDGVVLEPVFYATHGLAAPKSHRPKPDTSFGIGRFKSTLLLSVIGPLQEEFHKAAPVTVSM